MSTILNTNGDNIAVPVPHPATRVTIVTAKWNAPITHALRDGALEVLDKAGVPRQNIRLIDVPGTVELVNAAAMCMDQTDAVIIIGCVIRGDTPHFDYVCQAATQGMATLNAQGRTPVIFGVLTVENMQQALERAGGKLGNKGAEAAVAAIEMANMHELFDSHIH